MRADFGCGIHDYVFTTLNASVLTLVTDSVREALTLWEPRIELVDVRASTDAIRDGKLLINIDYRVRTTNNQFNLVYPFYLTEGA
jgi:phage baseplate assembly protein W